MEKTVFLLMILTLLSRLLGLGREMTLAYFYGASTISDAYLVSLIIPTVILGFIASGISIGYIPLYRQLEGEEKEQEFTNQVLNGVILLCGFIFLVGMFLTPQLVQIFASGFDDETLNVTIQFTRITLGGIFFTGIAHILRGYLQVKEKFLPTALVGIPFNLVSITFIIISSQLGIIYLAIGGVLAIVAQVVYLYLMAYQEGFRYKFRFKLKDESTKQMTYLAVPVIIGTSAEQINRLIDKNLATQVAIGGVSALTYGYRVMLAVQGIFLASVLTVLYPKISKLAVKNDIVGVKKSVSEVIIEVALFIVPAIVGFMVLAHPIVMLLYGRGAFTDEAAILTSQVLAFSMFSLFGNGIQDILGRVFYSLQDTRTPMINGTLAIMVNIVLNIILTPIMGIGGLALATSLSAMVAMVLMGISLHKKIGSLAYGLMTKALIKIMTASALMGWIVGVTYHYLSHLLSSNLALILTIGIGGGFYLMVIILMKIKEAQVILGSVMIALKKRIRVLNGNKKK